jgi:hypothetical protein
VLWLALLKPVPPHLPFGYRLMVWFQEWMHRLLTGRPSPSVHGQIPAGAPTPSGRLDLRPGELVRIKSKQEIERTLDERQRNRGLFFDLEEIRFCGDVFKVRSRVSRIIDEASGRMLQMKQPCIVLEGVVCNSECHLDRLNCPRAIPAYWRELWLERVEKLSPHGGEGHWSHRCQDAWAAMDPVSSPGPPDRQDETSPVNPASGPINAGSVR